MRKRPRPTRYVLLGQYLEHNADAVAKALETAGIGFCVTRAGQLTQTLFMGEWGVRIFVDRDSHDTAKTLAAGVIDA